MGFLDFKGCVLLASGECGQERVGAEGTITPGGTLVGVLIELLQTSRQNGTLRYSGEV